jgi:hypothetical protein
MRLIDFMEKDRPVTYPCNPPYDRDSIIAEGIPYDEWIRLLDIRIADSYSNVMKKMTTNTTQPQPSNNGAGVY